MIVRPYKLNDEYNMALQNSQSYMSDYIEEMDLGTLTKVSSTWVGEHDGKVLAMGGIIPIWQGRGQAWMLISKEAGKHFFHIHKAVKKELIKSPYRRVEATVDVGFAEGVRWMKMLGFEMEGYMKAYRPDGADMLMFARVRR